MTRRPMRLIPGAWVLGEQTRGAVDAIDDTAMTGTMQDLTRLLAWSADYGAACTEEEQTLDVGRPAADADHWLASADAPAPDGPGRRSPGS